MKTVRGVFVVLFLALAVACGPAAPSPAGEPAGIRSAPQVAQPGTQEDLSDQTRGAPQDEPKELPPDISHITLSPTNTPRPTLIPDLPAVATEAARLRAGDGLIIGQSGPALDAQVTEYTRDNKDNRYEAIVRAVVASHRVVEPNLDITWPDAPENPPYFVSPWNEDEFLSWRRTKLDIKKTYYGDLPQGYELLAPDFALNQALEEGKEYILYVSRVFVSNTDFPDRPDLMHYNEKQLNALGGAGGIASFGHTWIIDGDNAWRITRDFVLSGETRSGLAAAKANGDSLSVTALEAAIKRGLGN